MMSHQTSFSDVCGTVDELKRLLHEGSDKEPSEPGDVFQPLLSDANSMLERMKGRIEEYKAFQEDIRQICSQLEQIEEVDIKKGKAAIAVLLDSTKSTETFRNTDIGKLNEQAERIRSVASAQEHCLRTYKDLTLRIHNAFIKAKGSRPWLIAEEARPSIVEAVRRENQAWLPPGTHGVVLLEWLSASRAHLPEERGPDGEPFVQFEDGGCILMSQVRWDSEIRNFHPASFKPGPTGREYR